MSEDTSGLEKYLEDHAAELVPDTSEDPLKLQVAALQDENQRLRGIITDIYFAKTEFGNHLILLIKGFWPELWERLEKEMPNE